MQKLYLLLSTFRIDPVKHRICQIVSREMARCHKVSVPGNFNFKKMARNPSKGLLRRITSIFSISTYYTTLVYRIPGTKKLYGRFGFLSGTNTGTLASNAPVVRTLYSLIQ